MTNSRGAVPREDSGYLGAAGAAAILQVSPKTVARWAKEGKLPHMRTLGRHRRYRRDEIEQLAEQLRAEVTDVSGRS